MKQGAGDLPRPTGHRHQEGEVPPEGPQKPEPEGGQPRKLTVGGQKIPQNFFFKQNFLFGLLAGYRTKLLFSSCFGLGPGAGDEGVEGNRSVRRKWRKRKNKK